MLRCDEISAQRLSWAFLVATFLAIASNSLAAEFDFEVGHWVGKSEWSSGGHFESCMVSEHNDKNEILIIRLDRKRELTIGLFEMQWQATPQSPVDLVVIIDHIMVHSGKGWLQSKDALLIRLEPMKTSLSSLESGNDHAKHDCTDT